LQHLQAQISVVEQKVKDAAPLQEQELLEAVANKTAANTNSAGRSGEKNHNDDILFLHNAGKSDVEIAKDLGLGLGEVKLVIGLFKEENKIEI
jgi:hypothetical protein